MKKENVKSVGRKIWNFLLDSNSIWIWLVDLVLIFLIVKFIVFPLFGLFLGASLPFVIIESNSMEHEGSFDSWFELHGSWYLDNLDNITKVNI